MRMNDNFNIITGEVKAHHPNNTNSQRFASLDVLRKMKENKVQTNHHEPISINRRKLGTPQDSKLYQYSHVPSNYQTVKQQASKTVNEKAFQTQKKASEQTSLMNATKSNYNIISHTYNSTAKPNWEVAKKKCPVSKFTDLGRMNAPNYSETYKQESKFGKKQALCNATCQMQRSYGVDKYFRKFK